MREKFEEHKGDEVYVVHRPKDRATIAAVVQRDFIAVATAICSKKDQFSRKIGRHIAVGRAMKTAYEIRTRGTGLPRTKIFPFPVDITRQDTKALRQWTIDVLIRELESLLLSRGNYE